MADVITIQTSRGPFTVSRQHADRFKAFLDDPEWGDYQFDPKQSGGYNPRNIRGTNIPSQHSFGSAIDINWTRNARGTRGDIDPTLARTLAKRHGMTWGGDWSNPDPMHFEVARSGPVPLGQRGIANFAGVPKPAQPDPAAPVSAPADPPSPRMALGGPKPMPQDENGQWVPEQEIARRRTLANQYWDDGSPSGGGWAGALASLLRGGGHGYENAQMRQAIGGNQAMQQRVLQGAADAPDMARHLIGSGVPGLATQGVGMLAQRGEKEADRRAQLEQQKQLFEFQKKMQMDLKAQEQKQMLEQLRALGVIGGDAAPAPNAAPQAPNAAPPVAGQPPATSNPNSDFIEELIGGVESHKAPTPQQKAGIALALGEKGKAVDALTEKGAKLTEQQTKDASFAERMLRAEGGLREVVPTDKSGKFLKYDPTSNIYRFLPDWNVTNSAEWQTYTRNSREGIAAILRKDTGAAVTKEEWDWYFPMYYPQPGDSAQVVADKQKARVAVARGLRAGSGPGFDQMFPKFNDQLRQRLEAAGANLAPPSPAQQSGAAPNAGAQAAQYAQVKRNPKTGELAGYNPQTGKWEIIPAQAAAQRQEAPAPSLGEIGAP
jgi:hypothetical protein